jgi:hypothetical protein
MTTFLIHVLEHLGVPSGAAIAIAITGNKLLKGTSKIGARRSRDDRDRSQWHPHDYRRR